MSTCISVENLYFFKRQLALIEIGLMTKQIIQSSCLKSLASWIYLGFRL